MPDTTINPDWVSDQLTRNINRVLNPSVGYRALAKMRSADANFSQIAQLLSADPFISAKVVAVANLAREKLDDPVDAAPRPQVRSIERAVGLLGVRQVEALVMAVMLTGPLASRPYLTHRADVWRYIFGCAAAGDWLIPRLHPDELQEPTGAAEHMVCGLVLGFGVQLLHAGLGTSYSRLLGKRVRPHLLPQRERIQLGVDHHQVTVWALQAMRCPPYLARYPRALAQQEQTPLADEARAIELLGCRAAGVETNRVTHRLRELLDSLGLPDTDAIDEAMLPMRKRVRDLARVFRLELAMNPERREQLTRDTTADAGRRMMDMVEDEARRPDRGAA